MSSTATLNGVALKRIVFGTDFSPVAERAATYAKGLALSFAASVDVVHVFDTDVYLDDAEPRLQTLDDRLAVRSEKLEELAKTFAASGAAHEDGVAGGAAELERVAEGGGDGQG